MASGNPGAVQRVILMKIPAPAISVAERIAMATRCHDCDTIPKVTDAGLFFEDGTGRRLQVMHNGLRILADGYYGPWMTDLIRLCKGHHEPQEERIFHEVVRRLPDNATMIELGGYWSYYSLWFLMDQPDRSATVLEPEPVHLDVGRTNARLNGLAPEFLHGFAGAAPAKVAPFCGGASGKLMLPRFSVEKLMDRKRLRYLNLLHCDIQGAEVEVLDSCRALFRQRRIGWVFVSTHAHGISGDPLTHQRCLNILRDCGGIIEVEHDVHESFSGDGLIVARFGAPPAGWTPVQLTHNRHSTSLFRDLAYDLDESRQQVLQLKAQLASNKPALPLHPALVRSGNLLTLTTTGPLGQAGDCLIMPDDQVMAPAVLAQAAWAYQNIEQFSACLNPEKSYTLLDIGANVGLFSRQLAHCVPTIDRMICVEPEENNFKALKYNLHHLGSRVEFCNFALGSADEEQELFRDSANIGNYSLNPDAMRQRSFSSTVVEVRETSAWMHAMLKAEGALLWKSDTQGFDEVIVALTPFEIWQRIDVALIELWRIAKPEFDHDALRLRIGSFPNRQLGRERGISPEAILHYLSADDWKHEDLLLWR